MAARRSFPINPFLPGANSSSLTAAANASAHSMNGGNHAGMIPPSASSSSFSDSSSAPSSLDVSLRWIRFLVPDAPSVHRILNFWLHVMKMHLERQIDTGEKSWIGFQYPGDKIGIRFEYDRYGKVPRPRGDGPLYPSASSVSLVIYVDSAADYCARCRDGGFTVWIDPVSVCEDPPIRSAVLIDPTGIKVRIMEGEVYALNKMRCRGRLGYVSIPLKDYSMVERSMKFYDDVFRTSTKRTSSIIAAANGGGGGGGTVPSSPSASSSGKSLGNGFRLVDMERFVEELTTYVWLGNGNRKKHAAVCLFHKLPRKAPPPHEIEPESSRGTTGWDSSATRLGDGEEDEDEDAAAARAEEEHEQVKAQLALLNRKIEASEPEETKLFLGLSFTVNDIETAISFLRHTELGAGAATVAATATAAATSAQGSVSPSAGQSAVAAPAEATSPSAAAAAAASARLEVQHIPGFPRFISFLDPSLIPLEITDGAMGASRSSAAGTISSSSFGSSGLSSGAASLGGVGSATAAAMLMRSNMMRASAMAAAAAMAQSAAAGSNAAARATAATAAPAVSPAAPRRPHPPPAPLSFTPSPASTRAGSPSASPISGRDRTGDDWSDGEGGASSPRSGGGGVSWTAGARGRSARPRTTTTTTTATPSAHSDDSVSSDEEGTVGGIGSYVQSALNVYSGSGGSGGMVKTRKAPPRSAHQPQRSRSRRASPVGSPTLSPALTPSASPRSARVRQLSKSPSRPTTSKPTRSRPNSSKVR